MTPINKRLASLSLPGLAAFAALAIAAAVIGASAQEPAKERVAETAASASNIAAEPVGAERCLSCHANKESFKSNIHAKGLFNAKGIAFANQCEACHGNGSLHAGAAGDKNNPDFFTISNPLKEKGGDVAAACQKCHQGGNRMHWKGSAHDMKGVGCTSCHSMHDAEANKGRRPLLAKATQMETCFQCHADKKAQIKKSAHMPIVEGKMGCSSCHQPHGSTTDKLLAKNSVVETCYACHQDKRGPFLREHAPVRENCLTCHLPHGSHNDKMLVMKAPLLCQRCHQIGFHPTTAYGFTQIEAENPRNFNRGCVDCHSRIHGSNHPSGKYLER